MENFIYFSGGIIATIIFGFVFYRLSVRGEYPTYLQGSIKLIGLDGSMIPNEIEILFRDQPINRLVKTYVLIWNDGVKTIDGKNIATSLRINLEQDANILSSEVTKVTKHANKVNIESVTGNVVSFSFNYLDPKDGALIEILHQSTLEEIIFIDGDIKGVPKGIRPFQRNKVLYIFFKFCIIIFPPLLVLSPYVHPNLYLFIGALGIFSLIMLSIYERRRPYPKALRYKGIEFN